MTNNLGYWCADSVRRFPDRVALIDATSSEPRDVSYRELDERMNRVANLLRARGLDPPARVAMAIGNRFEFVEIMFGAMRAGLVPVPLNVKLGREALDYIVRDADVAAAFVEPSANRFAVEVIEQLGIEHLFALGTSSDSTSSSPAGWLDYDPTLSEASPVFEPPPIADEHPAFQPYTSGSTGRPKGVVLTHAGQLWWVRCLTKYWPEKSEARALAAVPLYHKNAMAGAIKPLLQSGGTVVILPDFEPERFLRALAHYRCTQAGAVPAVFTKLLQHRALIRELDFSALESLNLGSAPVQKELMLQVQEAFDVKVTESYGLTEGGPVMIGPPVDGTPVPFGSCGVCWPEGEVKLVAADGSECLEMEALGELWVRNPGVTPGYHNLPDVNRERLREGWLRTGDVFSRDAEGFYFFRGRTDDMFNCGGENIYPKEVEDLLLSHPDVYDAAVIAFPHAVKGHVPVALAMKAKNGNAIDEDLLKKHCLDHGPAYAHPRRVLVVERLPLNGAGKVDRVEVLKVIEDRLGTEPLGKGNQT